MAKQARDWSEILIKRGVVGPDQHFVGIGDFNGDGTSDVLWYNATTRDAEVWKISNGQWAGSVDVGTHPAGYQPAGSGIPSL